MNNKVKSLRLPGIFMRPSGWQPLLRLALGAALWGGLLLPPAFGRESRASTAGVDADALVHKMVLVYQAAQTIQETSEVKMKPVTGSDFIQTTAFKFKRPNLLYCTSTDPSLGTYTAFCNGKTVTVYTGTQNIFTKRVSPVGIRPMFGVLSKASEFLMHKPITQTLSPLSFVTAKGMPDECRKFRFTREEMVDGKRTSVVSGQADTDWLFSIAPIRNVVFDRKEVTLWIDTSRSVLVKGSLDIRWHVDVSNGNGKIETLHGGTLFMETHRNIVLNTPLRDEEFFFAPPPGSSEQFQESK